MFPNQKIAPAIAQALAGRGFERLTPVQEAVVARAGAGDLLVSAQTGSGKTVAFGIAIADQVLDGDASVATAPDLPRGLVVAPTRELALQVCRELEWLYAGTGIRIASCVGGMDMRRERRALEDGAGIVVGTPGRLRDHVTRGSLDISELAAIVLDEADEMLDLGFRDDLEFILSAAPAQRRTLMFSATVPTAIAELARRFQRDAERLVVSGDGRQHGDIAYRLVLVAPTERENAVINTLLFEDARNAIVFCGTRDGVRHLASRLSNRGFAVVALSGELSQAERSNALQSMRDGRARVCVATDVAARGIDLPQLDLVIHADLPSNAETLLHRSGRTGRAGRKGASALIVPHHRRRSAERLLKNAQIRAASGPAPGAAEIHALNRSRVVASISGQADASDEEAQIVRDLLAAHGAEALALAFARRGLADFPLPEDVGDEVPLPLDPALGERPAARFDNGRWFRVSLGRRNKAEPRWLLPLICKAGQVTRREVGSIRILERETLFEIDESRADAYEAALRRPGAIEKGVTIGPAEAIVDGRDTSGRNPKGPSTPVRKAARSGSSKPLRAGRERQRAAGEEGRKQPRRPHRKGKPRQ